MERTALTIDGMSCDHCVRAVRQALQGLDGAEVEQVGVGTALVAYDPERVSVERITGAIEDEGYTVRGTEPLK